MASVDRQSLSSSYSQQLLPLNSRPRQPLGESTGNTQYSSMATSTMYGPPKGLQPRLDHPPPKFTLPCLPSQPLHSHLSYSQDLRHRRESTKFERMRRNVRNPIVQSPAYRAYRSRQPKHNPKSKDDDTKWSDDLEEVFLDALLDIPKLGRKKFNISGKPHGRNELISLYLWLAHLESLAPGEKPDESKRRGRKQVSSHIQVLKNFMRGEPYFDRLFPPKETTPQNGFEDNYKNHPVLVALSRGHLPRRNSAHSDHSRPRSSYASTAINPSLLDVYMTVPGQNSDTPCRIHTYIQPELRKLQRCPIDHSLPQWRRQFSQLERAQAMNDLNCPLMHINASITLKHGLPPHDAELWGRFEIVIPPHEANLEWRCMQTLTKHKDLYGAAESDPPITNKMYPLNIDRIENGVGPIVRVGFPAMTWAHAMSRLSDIQEEFEKSRREGSHFPVPMTAREYVEQMTMYQEIYSSAGEGQEWKKRAVICWTFTKAKQGELNFTSWRYVDVVPQRRMLMSPHPGAHQEMQAQMSENFNAIYTNSQPLSIQPPTPYDNVFPGLTTPPASAVLQSPFSQYGYPSGHQSSQDLVPENMSSISQHTVSSDGHMDHHHQQAAQTMNHYLGSDPINPSYPQYDSAPQQMWQPPQVPVQQYEFQDSGYMSQPYTAMPSQGEVQVQVWDQDAARWGSTDTQAYPSYEMGPPKMR